MKKIIILIGLIIFVSQLLCSINYNLNERKIEFSNLKTINLITPIPVSISKNQEFVGIIKSDSLNTDFCFVEIYDANGFLKANHHLEKFSSYVLSSKGDFIFCKNNQMKVIDFGGKIIYESNKKITSIYDLNDKCFLIIEDNLNNKNMGYQLVSTIDFDFNMIDQISFRTDKKLVFVNSNHATNKEIYTEENHKYFKDIRIYENGKMRKNHHLFAHLIHLEILLIAILSVCSGF